MKWKKVLPVETCVIIDMINFQLAVDEIFGEDNWIIESEDEYLAQNGIHELNPIHADWDDFAEQVKRYPQWDWKYHFYIPDMILANMICDGYVPEGADHYYIDGTY